MGAAVPPSAEPAADEERIPIPPDCWDAVRLFVALERQWRRLVVPGGPGSAGTVVWLGLDLVAADVARRWMGLEAVDLGDLRVMEAEALGVLNS